LTPAAGINRLISLGYIRVRARSQLYDMAWKRLKAIARLAEISNNIINNEVL
jgi:hypothetical protein